MVKILDQKTYNEEVNKILKNGSLEQSEKDFRLSQIKNQDEINKNINRLPSYVPEDVKDKIQEFFSDDEYNERIRSNMEYERTKADEEEEKAGSLVEIFLDHITVGGVTVPLPTLRFYHLLERRFPSGHDKFGKPIKNEDLDLFGIDQEITAYVCYALSNAWEKGFEKKPDVAIQEEANEWFAKFGIMQSQVVAAVNIAMAHELNKKKLNQKIDLRKHTQ